MPSNSGVIGKGLRKHGSEAHTDTGVTAGWKITPTAVYINAQGHATDSSEIWRDDITYSNNDEVVASDSNVYRSIVANNLDNDPTTDSGANWRLIQKWTLERHLWKDPVRVATTANITLSGTQTIDGVSVVAGDRVLVKNQSTGSQNGIYVCAAGSWSRSYDADSSDKVKGGLGVFVNEGTVNKNQVYYLTTDDAITLGTTSLNFAIPEKVHFVATWATAAALAANTRSGDILTADANGALSVDSNSPSLGDTVLVKDESTGANNGVYVVTQVGDGSNPWKLTRAPGFASTSTVRGTTTVAVQRGSAANGYADSTWVLTTNDAITINTTSLTFQIRPIEVHRPELMDVDVPSGTGARPYEWTAPRAADGSVAVWNIVRLEFRVSTTSSSGNPTINIQATSAADSDAFTSDGNLMASDLSIPAGTYETNQTSFSTTQVTSGAKLRVNVVTVGTGTAGWSVLLLMRRRS